MASDDVIELGSSEDEAKPAPKKRKHTLNAMVDIPSKITEEIIKPIMSNAKPIATIHNINQKPKVNRPVFKNFNAAKGNQTSIKIGNHSQIQLRNPLSTGVIHKVDQKPVGFPVIKNFPKEKQSLAVTTKHKLTFDQATIQKMTNKRFKSNPVAQKTNLPKQLASLPGITIIPLSNAEISETKKKQKFSNPSKSNIVNKATTNKNKNNVGEVLTIELEDEEVTESSTGNPQWYLKPGERRHVSAKDEMISEVKKDGTEPSMEEINNKEPEKPKYVEITIEDSPVKPLQLKHSEVGKELPIIVEDSPIKPIAKNSNEEGSDTEQCVKKVPHSKKQLNYPKDKNVQEQIVEIEIDLMQTNDDASDNSKDHTNQQSGCEGTSKEQIQESAKQAPEKLETVENVITISEIDTQDTVAKIGIKEKDNAVTIIEIKDKIDNSKEPSHVIETKESEFHPVYQKFIDLCFELENSDDMKKIVEKKIKSYYKQCPKDYVESEEFIEMVSSKTVSMRASPDKMYLYIKDIVDELNVQRKMKITEVHKIEEIETESSKVKYSDESESDNKRQRQVKKLENTMKKLHRAIQKLEEQEVDFEDEEDSVYLLTERYKERMVRVHEKLCQMTNIKMPSEPRVHIEARSGRPQGPAKRLEMWINKKVPIGKPLPFPDFHDVLKCVREANSADKLSWNEVEIMEEARDLFTRCGKKLQRRRQENEWRIASSRVSHNIDPAEINTDLKRRLDENKSIAAKKETELFNKYADRQNQLKLEAEEIGDKEAEESPVESEEEEDVVETNTPELKQKRKEKIKMLLKDKPINNEEKENNPLSAEKTNSENETNEEKTKAMGTHNVATDSNKIDIELPLVEKQNVSNEEKVIDNGKETTTGDSVGDVIASNDQLNLLSELYTEYRRGSTAGESSDSGSSITISDTLESDSEAENKPKIFSDVISIENSSYSDNESMDGDDEVTCLTSAIVEKVENATIDIEHSTTLLENNLEDLYNVHENILELSDEDSEIQVVKSDFTCITLKDDNISITEVSLDGDVAENGNLKTDGDIPESADIVRDVDNIGSEPKSVDASLKVENDNSVETIDNDGSIPKSANSIDEVTEKEDTEALDNDGCLPESVNALDEITGKDDFIETIDHGGNTLESVNTIDEVTENEVIKEKTSNSECVEKKIIDDDSMLDNNNALEIQDSPIKIDNTSVVDEPMECEDNPAIIVERLQLKHTECSNSQKIVDFKNVITNSIESIDSEQTAEVKLTTRRDKDLNNFESNNENSSFYRNDRNTQNIVNI